MGGELVGAVCAVVEKNVQLLEGESINSLYGGIGGLLLPTLCHSPWLSPPTYALRRFFHCCIQRYLSMYVLYGLRTVSRPVQRIHLAPPTPHLISTYTDAPLTTFPCPLSFHSIPIPLSFSAHLRALSMYLPAHPPFPAFSLMNLCVCSIYHV